MCWAIVDTRLNWVVLELPFQYDRGNKIASCHCFCINILKGDSVSPFYTRYCRAIVAPRASFRYHIYSPKRTKCDDVIFQSANINTPCAVFNQWVTAKSLWRSVNNVNRILNFIIQYYYMLRLCLKPILYINSIIFIILIDYIITIKFFG